MVETEVSLKSALKNYFGFDAFKGDQEAIMQSVLDKQHTFVIMPTGGGKSLCYQLPALISPGTAVVVSPLIALMKNQVDAIRSLGSDEGIAHFLNSSLSKSEIQKVRKDVTEGRTKLLYVAPESLTKQENIDFLTDIEVSFFAIDEAHCISEWGHDFRPEYRKLRPMIDEIGEVPIIALTATATPKVQHDIQKNLGMLDANVYKASFNRPELYYEVRPKRNAVKEIIRFFGALQTQEAEEVRVKVPFETNTPLPLIFFYIFSKVPITLKERLGKHKEVDFPQPLVTLIFSLRESSLNTLRSFQLST